MDFLTEPASASGQLGFSSSCVERPHRAPHKLCGFLPALLLACGVARAAICSDVSLGHCHSFILCAFPSPFWGAGVGNRRDAPSTHTLIICEQGTQWAQAGEAPGGAPLADTCGDQGPELDSSGDFVLAFGCTSRQKCRCPGPAKVN